jgi:hypothetical protein
MVAAWPGMGNVALAAASYLVSKLGARPFEELPAGDYFDVAAVVVEQAVVRHLRFPKSDFFSWHATPESGAAHDLVTLVGEAQPSWRGYEYCGKVLDIAERVGVKRVFTFAAAPTAIHPGASPRVWGVVNDPKLLPWLKRHGVQLLDQGQISGLNGVLLGVAAARHMEAVCLLGELPFFAVALPNPKASHAVLEMFARMVGMGLDLDELAEQARAVEKGLLEMMQRVGKVGGGEGGEGGEAGEGGETPDWAKGLEIEEPQAKEGAEAAEGGGPRRKPIDRVTVRKVEELFKAAEKDRAKALELKKELDRLGLFKEYEDRFLDLFKKQGPS